MFTKLLKYQVDMTAMFFIAFREDENVIDEDDYKLVQILHEYGIHEFHEGGGCIGQTNGHDRVLVRSIASAKSGLQNVFFPNPDLVVA